MNLSHKKLDIWKFGLELVSETYKLTNSFPVEEKFGLTNQLRRASVSVPSNISEGLSRSSKIEKCRFLEISRSSIVEIDTQLEISVKLNFCTRTDTKIIEELNNNLFAMITSLIKKLRSEN